MTRRTAKPVEPFCSMPSGWTLAAIKDNPFHFLLTHPAGGMATLDFKGRCFRGGLVLSGVYVAGLQNHRGRAWQKRLMADAVGYLIKIYGNPEGKPRKKRQGAEA